LQALFDIGTTLGECLLTPTKIYVKAIMALLDAVNVKSISHINRRRFFEEYSAFSPDGISAKIDRSSVRFFLF
jgi:phosphoribosylformylglycinamidine cyclo-ligase